MNTDRTRIIVVPWYSRDDFDALRELAGDDSRFPPDFDSWERSAVSATEKLLAQGRIVQPLTIRVQDYLAWLEQTNRRNTAGARLRFLQISAAKVGSELSVLRVAATNAEHLRPLPERK